MPVNIDTRWENIQKTRRRHPSTREPLPGSLGVAYYLNLASKTVERVAVVHRDKEDAQCQRLSGGQLVMLPLSLIRTEDEIIDAVRKLDPDALPKKIVRTPGALDRWNPLTLPRPLLARVWESTK